MGISLNRKNWVHVQQFGRRKTFAHCLKTLPMAKRFKLQAIRIHQTYEVAEVADLLGASPQTIRKWIADGLSVLNMQRPVLILGFELKSYLQARQSKAKHKVPLGAFMCMSCNKPQMPFGLMADYIPMNSKSGRLEALCSVCEGRCARFSSPAKLTELSKILQIVQMPKREPNGTSQSTVKT